MGICEFNDAGRNGELLGQQGSTVASCSGHDLKAFVVRSDRDRLNESVLPDARGQFLKLDFVEGAAGIGGGLVDGIDGKILECAAVMKWSAAFTE